MNTQVIESIFSDLSNAYPDLELISSIKSGKEADVYLVGREDELYALKTFRQNTKFSTRQQYMELNSMKSRQKKAIMQKSNAGREMTQSIWSNTEFDSMQTLYEAGASIPRPYAHTDIATLMEYIGDLDSVAPRLADMNLSNGQVYDVFDQVVRNVEIFLECGIVHGDLSPYNILYWQERIVIIDFPQMMRIKSNPNARVKLRADIDNMVKYFSNYIDYRTVNELNRLL